MINLPINTLETLLPILPGARNVMPLMDLPGGARVVLAALDGGVVVPPHPMPREATLLLLSGAIDFLIEDTWHSVRPGQFLRIPNQASHSVRALEPSRFLVVQAQAAQA